MKSPFPGMDPYLEEHWGDVHTRMATYASDLLNPQLPGDLVARVEEHVALEYDEDDDKSPGFFPDVRVEEFANGPVHPGTDSGSVKTAEKIRVKLDAQQRTQRSIRIIAPRSGNCVITAIEIISRGNKIGSAAREAYRKKRNDLLKAGASVVEIDLIRAGHSVIAVPLNRVPVKYRGPYRICVRRTWENEAELYYVPLRRRLPIVEVPLRKSDADIALDMQTLIDLAYEKGRYERTNYREEPDPPLSDDDAAWADQLLREKGLR